MQSARFWDKTAAKYARDAIADRPAYEATLARMRVLLRPEHRVLELGCGTGSTALELAGGVDRYRATDVSPNMIDIACAKQGADTPPQLEFAVAPADGAIQTGHDVVLALNLLHLLPDLEDVVTRIHAALPAGGLFIAKTGLLRDGAWFLPWIIPAMRALGKAPYVRSLSTAELRALIEDAGFEITETVTQGGMAPRLFTVAVKR